MKPTSRILMGLAIFLVVDSTVYLVTAHEYTGGPLLLITGLAFAFLCANFWIIAHRAERQVKQDPTELGAVVLDHVGPTVWPAAFSVAAILLAIGAAIVWWLMIPGGILFVACAIGWFLDVRVQRTHHRSGLDAGHGSGHEAVSDGSGPAASTAP
jgi:Cytochrome c oxidase subunit IV